MIYDDIWYEIILISTFGKVAINGAQQKLNDKLVEEEERIWQVKFAIIDLWAIFFSRFAPFLFRYVTKVKAQEVLNSTKNKRAINNKTFFLLSDIFY